MRTHEQLQRLAWADHSGYNGNCIKVTKVSDENNQPLDFLRPTDAKVIELLVCSKFGCRLDTTYFVEIPSHPGVWHVKGPSYYTTGEIDCPEWFSTITPQKELIQEKSVETKNFYYKNVSYTMEEFKKIKREQFEAVHKAFVDLLCGCSYLPHQQKLIDAQQAFDDGHLLVKVWLTPSVEERRRQAQELASHYHKDSPVWAAFSKENSHKILYRLVTDGDTLQYIAEHNQELFEKIKQTLEELGT